MHHFIVSSGNEPKMGKYYVTNLATDKEGPLTY